MKQWVGALFFGLTLTAGQGCNVYDRSSGEVNAGPVDPTNFPPEELGAKGNRLRSGTGVFYAARGYVGNTQVDYYSFSLSAAQLAAADPTDLAGYSLPTTYVFDPSATAPVPAKPLCTAASVDLSNPGANPLPDQQGNIFTALPTATYAIGAAPKTSYVPIVAEQPVTSRSHVCQSDKSEATLLTDTSVSVGTPDGKYPAFAVIDPGAAVYRSDKATPTPDTGLGLQTWGWYGRYLLAYLNGGYVPTIGGKMVAQKLYYPRNTVDVGGSNGVGPGSYGKGYDVLEARRSDTNYSPFCQLLSYDTGSGTPVAAGTLPKSAADILASYGGTLQAGTPAYVFCLQVQ